MNDEARIVTLFGGARVSEDSPLYAGCIELGRLLAEAGFAVASGGYTGVMEAVLRGASEAGAYTIGYTCATFQRDFQPNRWVAEERKTRVLSTRIQRLLTPMDCAPALSGMPVGAACSQKLLADVHPSCGRAASARRA